MTAQDQNKIQKEVVNKITQRLRLEGHDFFALPPMTRTLQILAFQAGVEYWQTKIKEAEARLKL